MAQNITLMGANYSAVPAVTLPKTGGGTAKFTDVTPTTATDPDVLSGKIYFKSDGTQSTGTGSGGSTPTIQSLSVTPSTSQQTFNASGVDGYKPVVVDAMPSGSAKPATTISSTGATLSTSSNTITLTKNVTNTPVVTAGYVASGTAGTSSVSLSATVTLQGATTYYPTTSDQTINGSRYLTGTQTIKAVSQTNLTAANIKNGTTISISNGNGNIWSVTGTYSGGGGGGMNAQSTQSTSRATSSSYTEVISLTCAVAGTYDVYWSTFRSSTSGTWGSQLYINDTAYGSAQTGSWSNHIQNIHLTGVSLSANDDVTVRVRTRGSNYYGYVGTLTIIQKS